MNCMRFQKYLAAFADGELDVQQNLNVLEHVNMCPACAERAAQVPVLKNALKRVWDDVRAPEALRERIEQALDAEGAHVEPELTEVGGPTEPRAGARNVSQRWRVLLPLALAASVLLLISVWRQWNDLDMPTGSMTVIATRTLVDVRAQHRECVRRGYDHQDPSLGRDLATIRERLSARLGLVVLAPDLTDRGFELVGADACGVKGRRGAHVLYRAPSNGATLSTFTLDRVSDLNPDGLARVDDRDYLLVSAEGLAVAAWHDGPQTYIMCGEVRERTMLQLVDDQRVAVAPFSHRWATLLASLGASPANPR